MSDEPQYVVLDTNVLISAFLSSSGVTAEAAFRAAGSYTIAMSPETFRELETKLAEPKFDRFATADERREYLDNLREGVRLFEPTYELPSVSRDADDDKFLALALSCGADQIVSSDRHLTELKHYQGIQIWTPEQFLERERLHDIEQIDRNQAEPTSAATLSAKDQEARAALAQEHAKQREALDQRRASEAEHQALAKRQETERQKLEMLQAKRESERQQAKEVGRER
jgi:putative PIN family toxin of toxin-antitoxin system